MGSVSPQDRDRADAAHVALAADALDVRALPSGVYTVSAGDRLGHFTVAR